MSKYRGFWCTLPEPVPYLIDLHMTIDGWQEGRDAEGWHMKKRKNGEDSEDRLDWNMVTQWLDEKSGWNEDDVPKMKTEEEKNKQMINEQV